MWTRTVRYCAGLALAALAVSGCGTTVSVPGAGVSASSSPARTATSAITDDTLRVILPTDWKPLTGHHAIQIQEDLAHRSVWRVGGSVQQPAELIAVHEADTAPRPGTDVSTPRLRGLIDRGLQGYLAQPEAIGDFAQGSGHGCFTGFQPKQPVLWEQQGFVGLALQWTCIAQVPTKGWGVIAFDPAGVKHRFVITATPDYWAAHQTQIDDVRRSLTALATAP